MNKSFGQGQSSAEAVKPSYLLYAADGLEVDVVVLSGRQRRIPEAAVGLVVPNREAHGLHQLGGWQLGRKVVR